MLMLFKKLSKYSTILVIAFYFLINLFFMRSFWSELFFDRSTIGARYGEVFVAEWAMDKVYQNIVLGKNPFAHSNAALYPFGLDFTTTDSGNGFFFVFLRPFLTQHQSMSIIVALNLFFANLGMYFLLRKLKISRLTSFTIGLAYGYMTFLMPRMGHLNYTAIFVFPWFYYLVLQIGSNIPVNKKILASIFTAILFTLTLYLNLYYFIILTLSICFFILYWLIFNRAYLLNLIKHNFKYLLISFFSILIFTYPWIRILLETRQFEDLPETIGWGGAIEFSSDLFGFFVPSTYSHFMNPVASWIGNHFSFASHIFEEFSYPGLIIIMSLVAYFYLYYTKKLSRKFLNITKPYLFVSCIFLILTLGPFLHVFGKWGLTVDDGIRIVIPLPFVILHYLPFISNIRVPGRLIVGFIFFAYIITSYLLNFILLKKRLKLKILIFGILIFIFIIDHYFIVASPKPSFIPTKLYNEIKKDEASFTVMEVPSTIRDGFVYFGSSDSLEFIIGQSIYNKPVLGGYMGRIPYFKRAYYQSNPFLGYVGRLIDKNIKLNGGVDRADLKNWRKINLQKSLDAINFLDLKYFVIKEDEHYSPTLLKDLNALGFYKIKEDKNYSLLARTPENKEYTSVFLGSENDEINIGMGWGNKEDGFRWSGKKSSILFKLNNRRNMTLRFKAGSFYKPQMLTVFVNRKEISKLVLPLELKNHEFNISKEYLNKGINFVYFMFKNTYQPKNIIPNSLDDRNLAAKFIKVELLDQ